MNDNEEKINWKAIAIIALLLGGFILGYLFLLAK